MSLTGSEMSPADYAAISGNNNGVFGNNDGIFWLFILFMFFGANGWGNNGYGNAGGAGNEIQRGFDQNAIMGGFTNLGAQMNAMQMQQQNCCCDTRQAVSDVRYAVGNEAAATRQAIGDTRYAIASEACATRTADANNTRDIIDAIRGGDQMLMDKICALELDGYKSQLAQAQRENVGLQNQLNMANLAASQTAQNTQIVDSIYNRLSTCPVGTVPVYGESPIFTCNNNVGCSCNGGF